MSTELKLRRGSEAEHATFVGALGEVTFNTTKKVLITHDGTSPGGYKGFQQTGTKFQRYLEDKVRERLSITDCGAIGDGSDETSVIQAFIDAHPGREIFVPTTLGPGFRCSIVLPPNTRLTGEVSPFNNGGANAAQFSTLLGIAGRPVISFSTTPAGGYTDGVSLSNLLIVGGSRGLDFGDTRGFTNPIIRDVRIISQTEASIYIGYWVERGVFDHIECTGAPYGILLANNGSINNYLDKTLFSHCRLSGTVSGGYFMPNRASSGVVWTNLILNGCGKDAFVCNSRCSGWNFFSPGVEANGSANPPKATTTGSIAAGTSKLMVATTNNISVGQQLTIQGAGTAGDDLLSKVAAIVGTTITLADIAVLSVSGTEVTNCLYTEFLGGDRFVFQSGNFGGTTVNDRIQYAFKNLTASVFINCNWARPLYDPLMQSTFISCSGPIRTRSVETGIPNIYRQLRGPTRGSVMNEGAAVYPGNPGFGAIVSLRGVGTTESVGPYGSFRMMRTNAKRDSVFVVDDDRRLLKIGETDSNWNLLMNGASAGSGAGVISLKNADAIPSISVRGQGQIYIEDGALKFRGGNGTITVLAPA